MHTPTSRPQLILLLALLVTVAACSRTELAGFGPASTRVDARSQPETSTSDVLVADLDGEPVQDVGPVDAGDRPALPIPTPTRSDAVNQLYCELDNGQLVQGALRGGACLGLSVAGFLDEASRGFVFGYALLGSYAQSALGDCEFIRCLSNATNCADAETCQSGRLGGACDAFEARCDGDALESCLWNGETYEWTTVQHCNRAGVACRQDEVCDRGGCRVVAGCGERERDQECLFGETCVGDAMVRCLPVGTEEVGRRIEIPCGELVEGGTCVQTPIGGEFPGPACSSREQACVNAFAEGFACDDDGSLSLCLYGDIIEIQCQDYGYAGCDNVGFFGARCRP